MKLISKSRNRAHRMRATFLEPVHRLLTGVNCFCLFVLLFWYCIIPYRKFGSPYLGKVLQPRQQRYPFLSVRAVFSCVQ